mmetsp:Transcript_46701/g.131394  ORF Transcript_46701/g.131394 Transcript_46701/m.131394 type:complete len:262 (-) Transcript_46701:509-1294(-)
MPAPRNSAATRTAWADLPRSAARSRGRASRARPPRRPRCGRRRGRPRRAGSWCRPRRRRRASAPRRAPAACPSPPAPRRGRCTAKLRRRAPLRRRRRRRPRPKGSPSRTRSRAGSGPRSCRLRTCRAGTSPPQCHGRGTRCPLQRSGLPRNRGGPSCSLKSAGPRLRAAHHARPSCCCRYQRRKCSSSMRRLRRKPNTSHTHPGSSPQCERAGSTSGTSLGRAGYPATSRLCSGSRLPISEACRRRAESPCRPTTHPCGAP